MLADQAQKQPALLYSRRFGNYNYGPVHPLRVDRLILVHDLIRACGLPLFEVEQKPASTKELGEYHDRRYLGTLQKLSRGKTSVQAHGMGFGHGDNPVFRGMYDLAALSAGGTLQAVDLVSGGHPAAFNISGGMHHALAGRAAGFCYVNDPVLGIKRLVSRGHRVVYVDIDAHHGDGVQWAFYHTDQVLTISLHQNPATLFPGTGSLLEMGKDLGRGYSVNLPLWADTDDDIYMRCFDETVPALVEAFRPDYVVTQLGSDTFWSDPLANLNLTTRGYGHCVKRLKELARGRWIALGGGGYNVANVARAWTLVWAIMLGREDELPEHLPADFCEQYEIPPEETRLLDPPDRIQGRYTRRAGQDADEAIAFIQKKVLPLIGGPLLI